MSLYVILYHCGSAPSSCISMLSPNAPDSLFSISAGICTIEFCGSKIGVEDWIWSYSLLSSISASSPSIGPLVCIEYGFYSLGSIGGPEESIFSGELFYDFLASSKSSSLSELKCLPLPAPPPRLLLDWLLSWALPPAIEVDLIT